jgi:Fe2+ or Zn2+ uptake regulation protein
LEWVRLLKSTKQKEGILATVRAMNNHPTADEIYRKLRESCSRLSMGTVYRNLNAFAQKGDIRRVIILGGGDRYDFRTDNHEHMLCENCGQVIDVEAEVEINLKESDRISNKYTLKGYTLFLHGLCSDCRLDEGGA